MTSAASIRTPRPPLLSPTSILQALFERQNTLALLGLALAAALVPAGILSLTDVRMLDGVNVWIKPMKFMASLSLFALTMAWFIGYVEHDHRKRWPVRTIVAMITVATLFEIIYITLQAALGKASHFNTGDPLHAAMYSIMGLGAVSLTATTLVLAVVVTRHGDAELSKAFKLSLVLGLVLTFLLGTASGAFMSAQAGHFAGGLKAADGLPMLGWSTVGGDWRVAHFFGMHAQQFVPAFGTIAAWAGGRRGTAAVVLFCAGYTALTAATFAQAAMNLPFVAL